VCVCVCACACVAPQCGEVEVVDEVGHSGTETTAAASGRCVNVAFKSERRRGLSQSFGRRASWVARRLANCMCLSTRDQRQFACKCSVRLVSSGLA